MQPSKQKKFLALGDSYTIGEAVGADERWPVMLVERLRQNGHLFDDPQIIATTGWKTGDLKAAILDADPVTDFDLVSLLIGVNNQYQGNTSEDYAAEFEELLNMAIAFAGGDTSKVMVLSIPDYGFTPFGSEKQRLISPAIDSFNAVNKRIASSLDVTYIDITPVSRLGLLDAELVANDGLHPSGKMYDEWVKIIMDRFTFEHA
jgi:lysophospholipase L1-like esterase